MSRQEHVSHDLKQAAAGRRYTRAAAIGALAVLALTALAFLKGVGLAGGYVLHGVFASGNRLKPGSEVRTEGVRVGKVRSIDPGPGHTAIVTMQIDDSGRPVHTDATMSIQPRLLLEGNFYVNLEPGTGHAAELRSGGTIPLSQTAIPVQLDQVLDVFDTPTRGALHRSIQALASGLGDGGQAGAPGRTTGFEGFRRAVRELDRTLGGMSDVARAMRGTRPGDLPKMVKATGDFTEQLARDPRSLADLMTHMHRFFGILADQDLALARSIQGLDGIARTAPASLRALDAALPVVTRFGDALQPAMHAAPAPLRSATRLLAQLGALTRPAELPALLSDLEPLVDRLPNLERRLGGLLPHVTPINTCLTTHVVPTLDQKLQDGPNSTGDPVWLDLLHSFTGFTAAAPGFDGNGVAVRTGLSGGEQAIDGVIPGLGRVVGNSPQILGVRPTWLGYGVEPPYRPDESCSNQPLPDLNARSGPPPAWAQMRHR